MASYELKEISDKKQWESFISKAKVFSFLQSWNWGEVRRGSVAKVYNFGLFKKNKLVGICLVEYIRARSGHYYLIPGGPVIDWSDSKAFKFLVNSLVKLAKKDKAWFIRVRPEIEDNPQNRRLFDAKGFIPSQMHVHAENTWILDINKSLDEILKGMRKNTRYSIRQSLNYKLKVYQTTDLKSVKILDELQQETIKRHKFVGFSSSFFRRELEIFSKDNQARMFVCEYEGKPVAAAIIIFYQNSAYYHFSGSSSRNLSIPYSYFLQWKIIQEAKKRGMKKYNFWGVAPNDNKKHRFHGVTIFKTGFGGERIDWLHARDLVISPKYYLTRAFETFRKKYRNL